MMRDNLKLLLLTLAIMLILAVGVGAGDLSHTPDNIAKGVLIAQFMQSASLPLAKGRAYIYDKAKGPPSAERYVRVPDYIADLDNNGKLTLELPAGTYYFIARKVPNNAPMGPPAEGELIYFPMDSKKGITAFLVSSGKTTNAGIISTAVPRKSNHDKGATVIEGTVTDAEGALVEGAVIYAYINPGILDKAFYVSGRTGKDGKFELLVNDGGTYYLRVRGDYGGGAPKEGEIVSISDPKDLITVNVAKGTKRTGVAIQVKRQQRGPLFNPNSP